MLNLCQVRYFSSIKKCGLCNDLLLLALDASQAYHYYQTTRYTVQNEWRPSASSGMNLQYQSHNRPPLSQSSAYYIKPVAVTQLNKTRIPTVKNTSDQKSSVLFVKPLYLSTIFLNRLPSNEDDNSTGNMIPLNPAPMLKPNPFVNAQGQQIKFATTKPFDGNQYQALTLPQRKEEGEFCRRSFDGRSGYCILAYQCLHVIREYRLQGIAIDICTYRKNIPVICCPLADKHIEEQRISAQSK